jgi:hypothetical protein
MLACLIVVRPSNISGMGCKQKSCGNESASGSERFKISEIFHSSGRFNRMEDSMGPKIELKWKIQ